MNESGVSIFSLNEEIALMHTLINFNQEKFIFYICLFIIKIKIFFLNERKN